MMHRVMHLLTSFQVGGAEVVALNLADSLDRRMFQVSACSLSGSGAMADRFRAAGIEARHLLRRGSRWRNSFLPALELARLLKKERIQVLHCHNNLPRTCGTIAARLAGVPVVVCTQHAVWYDGATGKPALRERLTTPFITHFVAVAHHVLRTGVSSGRISSGRSSVIYNGIDVARFAPVYSPRTDEQGVVVGCVARLSQEKRHALILQAMAHLAPRHPDLRLRLVGDGRLREALQAQARQSDLLNRVEFLGRRDDVAELLRAMDVFVLASSTEGLPLTVLEAMATALPVVATKVGALEEVVEDGVNGFLVPPDDPGALAGAIDTLVKDKAARTRMGKEGRRIAVEKFSLRKAARRHEELYLRLLAEKGFRSARRRDAAGNLQNVKSSKEYGIEQEAPVGECHRQL